MWVCVSSIPWASVSVSLQYIIIIKFVGRPILEIPRYVNSTCLRVVAVDLINENFERGILIIGTLTPGP